MDSEHGPQRDENFNHRMDQKEGDAQGSNQSHSHYVQTPKPTYYREKRTSFVTIAIVALIASVIGGLVGAYMGPKDLRQDASNAPTESANPQPKVEIVTKDEDLGVIPAVAKKAMPSVVGITTVTVERDWMYGTRRGQGVGTGVIVDSRGYILTNSHVVNDGKTEEVTVLLHDGRNLRADVLWNDALLDLAVIKVATEELLVADLGDSDEIIVGETTIAIGNPLGLTFERSVTSGIISGLERSIPINEFESIEGLIQTDASINPGNSGGPLLNGKGQVIGINTAKIQTGEGLGFAIPINMAKPIVDEFIEKGEFTKVYLGIRGLNVQQYIRSYGNDVGAESGVFVYQVSPDSPVARAGMKDGDVIIAMGEQQVDTMGQLVRQLYKYRPGDEITISVLRNGERIDLRVLLEAAPRA